MSNEHRLSSNPNDRGHDPESSWERLFEPNATNDEGDSQVRSAPSRRWLLWFLFFATLLSMAWTGVTVWSPQHAILQAFQSHSLFLIRRMFLANSGTGMIFALSLLWILTAHELGHYFMTRIYGVPSTPPIFIPFPVSPIGTCGALIMMDGAQADRRQIFDIGIAGPLTGLVALIPVLIAGLLYDIPPRFAPMATFQIGQPLLIQWFAIWLKPSLLVASAGIANTELNPFLMAAWVGLLVTGLNMMPISQLDGGHVAFGLIGDRSIHIARAAFAGSILYLIATHQVMFTLMLFLVLLMGLRHPPSRDDSRSLGLPRQVLGWISLSIPLLCIPARTFIFIQ